jgi:hypothetical protein
VGHVHRGELRMRLAHRLRRPLRRALPFPATGTGDEPTNHIRSTSREAASTDLPR